MTVVSPWAAVEGTPKFNSTLMSVYWSAGDFAGVTTCFVIFSATSFADTAGLFNPPKIRNKVKIPKNK